ncbi:MAG: hypothetical protein CL678_03865 [Bdellovibrionaceae bacterium]|nr:hypothetical protein [Pseudobdellovibrionaceae bacterium]|tara:strand:+ start:3906 stop:4811 length:906 start_codon:yes stop_codon:yes gene_type:complete
MNFFNVFCFFFSLSSFASVGTVASVQGEAFIGKKKMFVGQKLLKGDVVKIGAGKATLIFGRDAVIHLDAESELQVNEYLNEGKQIKADFKLKYGKIRSLVKSKGVKQKKFRFRTRSAVMGVRGTHIYIDSPKDPEKPLNFLTVSGEADVFYPSPNRNQVEPLPANKNTPRKENAPKMMRVKLKTANAFQADTRLKSNPEQVRQGPRVTQMKPEQVEGLTFAVAPPPPEITTPEQMKMFQENHQEFMNEFAPPPPPGEIADGTVLPPLNDNGIPLVPLDPVLDGGQPKPLTPSQLEVNFTNF